ncbi:MAG TPA: hypothetical protein ENH82_15025 [bacterium]|nr:hypothetical protein [bacterium]
MPDLKSNLSEENNNASIETWIESGIYSLRWILLFLYTGLILTAVILCVVFLKQLFHMAESVFYNTADNPILATLSLIDIVLLANVLFIIAYSSYESFLSKLDIKDQSGKLHWIGKIGIGEVKIKVLGSVMAIAAIECLKILFEPELHDIPSQYIKVLVLAVLIACYFLAAYTENVSHPADKVEDPL